MRQVFSSARLETAEGVAALLNEHDIETRITDGRSYKGSRRRSFSFRDNDKEPQPEATVWVVKSEDQPKARALLREAGLMDSTRDSFLPDSARQQPMRRTPTNAASRIRVALLAAVVILAVLTTSRGCKTTEPEKESIPESHIVPVELSLG